jgi:hypothetical protein
MSSGKPPKKNFGSLRTHYLPSASIAEIFVIWAIILRDLWGDILRVAHAQSDYEPVAHSRKSIHDCEEIREFLTRILVATAGRTQTAGK